MDHTNDLQIFSNPKFGEIRMVLIDGKEYFVAADVARALGYARPADAVSAHCKGAVKRRILTNGGEQEMNCIPIGDLCRLASSSELHGAAEYESWIFDEVVPSIHKTGAYIAPQSVSPLALFEQMLAVAKAQDRRVTLLEGKVQTIQDTICDRPEDWRTEVHDMITRAAKKAGGKYQEFWQQAYNELEDRAGVRLNIRLENLKFRLAGKIPSKEYAALSKLDAIKEDRKLRELFFEIAKKFVIATI